MGKATITKVDNGFILEVTTLDFVSKRPETVVTIHTTLDEAVEAIKQARI